MGARIDTFDTFGFGNPLPSETATSVGPDTYLGVYLCGIQHRQLGGSQRWPLHNRAIVYLVPIGTQL